MHTHILCFTPSLSLTFSLSHKHSHSFKKSLSLSISISLLLSHTLFTFSLSHKHSYSFKVSLSLTNSLSFSFLFRQNHSTSILSTHPCVQQTPVSITYAAHSPLHSCFADAHYSIVCPVELNVWQLRHDWKRAGTRWKSTMRSRNFFSSFFDGMMLVEWSVGARVSRQVECVTLVFLQLWRLCDVNKTNILLTTTCE